MKWEKVLAREGVDITTISEIDVVFYDLAWAFTKSKKEVFFSYIQNKYLTHYMGVGARNIGRYSYEKYFDSPEKIKKYYEEGKLFLKHIEKTSFFWKDKLNSNSSREDLLKAFEEFRNQFKKISYIYSIISWWAIEAWQKDFDDILSNLLEKNKVKDRIKVLNAVCNPWKKTSVYEIQERLGKGESVSKLIKEFQFLRSWVVVWYNPLDKTWFNNLRVGVEEKEESYSMKKVLELLKPNKTELKFFEIAPYMAFFKDWRDDVRRKHAYLWSFLFDIIAKKFGVEHNDIGYLMLDEIEECLLSNDLDKFVIERRKKYPCVVTADGSELKMKIIDQNIPKKYLDIMKEVEKKKEGMIIKGNVAQKGKVKGKVIIVRSYHDIKRVRGGDILVANTTHPNYLPAMQKAAAFVTNEGGMISHAAIVSREMRKPCIVGTKIATKVLKDGDIIEVDADKGIVKKIKS